MKGTRTSQRQGEGVVGKHRCDVVPPPGKRREENGRGRRNDNDTGANMWLITAAVVVRYQMEQKFKEFLPRTGDI